MMGRRKRQRSSTGSRSSHGGIGSDRRSSHSVGSSTVQPAMLSLLIAALLGSQTTTHAFITLRQSHVGVIPRTASKRSSILIAKNKKQYYTNSQQEEVDQLQPFYQTSFSNSSLLPPLLELSNLPPSFYLPDDISTLTDSIKNGTSTPSSTTAASATNSSVTTTTTLLVKPSVKKRRSKPALEDVLKAQKQMKLSNRHSGGVQPSVEPTPQTSTASFTSRKRERKPQDSLDKFARDITTVLKELRPTEAIQHCPHYFVTSTCHPLRIRGRSTIGICTPVDGATGSISSAFLRLDSSEDWHLSSLWWSFGVVSRVGFVVTTWRSITNCSHEPSCLWRPSPWCRPLWPVCLP